MSSKGVAGFNAGLVKSVGNGYTPTEWATGDVITADKLNHMEEGIEASFSDGNFVPIFTFQNGDQTAVTCDKTYEEVRAAVEANSCHMAKAFWDGMPRFEECYRLVDSRYDENIIFNHLISSCENRKLTSIGIATITYYSSGTITYKYGSTNFIE